MIADPNTCPCNSVKQSVSNLGNGLYQVRCRICQRRWKTVNPPRLPKWSRRDFNRSKPRSPEPDPAPKPTLPIGRGWTAERRERARQRALDREARKYTTESPPDAQLVDDTFYELTPDAAERYRQLRRRKQLSGEVPMLLMYNGVIPA